MTCLVGVLKVHLAKSSPSSLPNHLLNRPTPGNPLGIPMAELVRVNCGGRQDRKEIRRVAKLPVWTKLRRKQLKGHCIEFGVV